MGGGADLGGLGAMMNDPEILEALQDPDVQKAFSVSIHWFSKTLSEIVSVSFI
jgi:hypothetical protein